MNWRDDVGPGESISIGSRIVHLWTGRRGMAVTEPAPRGGVVCCIVSWLGEQGEFFAGRSLPVVELATLEHQSEAWRAECLFEALGPPWGRQLRLGFSPRLSSGERRPWKSAELAACASAGESRCRGGSCDDSTS